MKTKKVAFAALAIVLLLALTGCIGKFIPTVVKIDGTGVSSGMYLLMQLNAYNEAMGLVGETKQELKTPDDLFKATIEDKKGDVWIADKTLENCKEYVLVLKMAKKMKVTLSDEDKETINSSLEQWDSVKATYEANGIGEETVRKYYEYSFLANNIFIELYKEGGEFGPTKDELAELYSEKYSHIRFMVVPLADQTSAEGDFSETAEDARIAVKALVGKLNAGEKTLNEAAHQDLSVISAIVNPLEEGQEPEVGEIQLDEDGEEILSTSLYAQFLSNEAEEPEEAGTPVLYIQEFLTRLSEEKIGTFGYYESEAAKAMIIYEKIAVFETDKEYEDARENMVGELKNDEFKEYMKEKTSKYSVDWVFGAKWFYSPKKVVTAS